METICYAIPDNRRKTNACKKLAAGTHPTDTSATLQTSGLNQELTGEEMISVHGSPDPHGNRRKLQNELEDPALITTVRRHLSIHDTRLQDKPRKTKLLGLAAAVHTRQHLKTDNFRISLWALPGRLSLGSPYMQNLKYSDGDLNCNLQSRRRIPGMAQTVTPLATPEGDLPHALRRAYGGRKKSRVPFLSQILKGKHNKNYRISLRDLPSSPLYGDASPFPKTNCFKDRS